MARRPLNGVPPITQVYGVRDSVYRKGYHTGVDYGIPTNTAVLSPGNGTVIQVGDGRAASDGRGYFMIIQTDDGVTHHLYHLNRWHVGGGRVSEGQHVADSDNTGMSTGPHLHWETRRGSNDFNPADWLFAPTPAPAPAPATGGEMFNTREEVIEAYLMLRGSHPSDGEIAGWIGKSKQRFFQVARAEADQARQIRAQLEGQVGNLAGQIQNLTNQVNDLAKRPTAADLAKLKEVSEKAEAQATKDRQKAEQLQKELEEAKSQTIPVDEKVVVTNWFKSIWDSLFKKKG